MERVHDLGGRSGFGAVPVDDDAIFHADWERRAFGVTQMAQGLAQLNTDAFRHGIEREHPATYLAIDYFDKWIRNAERMLVDGGVLAPDAVAAHLAGTAPVGQSRRTITASPPAKRGAERPIDQPARFGVGDQVRVVYPAPGPGHTRCPSYVAGHVGTVEILNGTWVFPDSNAHGHGERPCWVYAVSFAAADLWPADGAAHRVVVDLFEPYLSRA